MGEKFNDIKESWILFVQGDNDALSEVYEAYYLSCYFTAYQCLKDEEQAKDVVAQLFLSLIEKSTRKRSDLRKFVDNVSGFLVQSSKNLALNLKYQNQNRAQLLEDKVKPLYYNEDEEVSLNIASLNDNLTPREKEIVDLKILGMRHEDISSRLGVSRNTVKNMMVSAKKKILANFKNISLW